MERQAINPWEWSKAFGFSQAIAVKDPREVLFCSGQTAMGPDGSRPLTSDMAEQIRAAFSNLATVLKAAGMTMADVVKLTVYTTDVDVLWSDYETATQEVGPALPAMTLIGVTRLAFPELKVEIEAVAVR